MNDDDVIRKGAREIVAGPGPNAWLHDADCPVNSEAGIPCSCWYAEELARVESIIRDLLKDLGDLRAEHEERD
jgi:hypothetical protein